MKRSTVIIYSVLISTIFVISLSFFGYNIYNELKHGNERTRKTFQHFTNQIEKNINSTNKDYLSYIENPRDFLAITIKEKVLNLLMMIFLTFQILHLLKFIQKNLFKIIKL